MSTTQATGDFVQQMIGVQSRLYAFIMSLVHNPEQAADVLQATNLVMWQKADQFEPGTNFSAWAFQIARYQVMALRQRQRRDRHIYDDETIAAVAEEFEKRSDLVEDRLAALSHCMGELNNDGRQLIQQRYRDGMAVAQIAAELGHTANRVAVRLHRLRVALLKCIEQNQLQEQQVPLSS